MSQSVSHEISQVDLRPQTIDSWINDLPRGNVGRTSELIYKALRQINQQQMKTADRFRILESLRESVQYSTANLSAQLKGSNYPLPEKLLLIASACHSLYNHMIHGYYTVFHELKKQKMLFVDKGMLNTAIHRAIRYLQQSLFLVYKTYSAFHHGYWEQLHELYQYAEDKKISTNTIADDILVNKRKTSIESEYMHSLLLYLAEPYHLRPGEIEIVNHYLEQWHDLVNIEKVTDLSELIGQEQLFIIELDQDQPPFIMEKNPVNSEPDNCRIFSTSKLIQELTKILAQRLENTITIQSKLDSKSIRIGLLRRLIESWGQTKKRRYPRNTLAEKVNITIGLHQTHMQLLYEQHVKQLISHKDAYSGFYTKSEYEAIDVQDASTNSPDVWSAVYAWTNVDVTKIDKSAASQKQITDLRVKQDNWTLINESAEGFCIMSIERESNKIQVGEVISLQRKESTQRSIGLVRWIKAYGECGIQIGGMLLAPSALSVSVSIIDQDNQEAQNQIVDRCLLLPLMQCLNRPETIMTFARQYKVGDILELSQANKKTSIIKLNKVIADNGMLSQFLFTTVDDGRLNTAAGSDLDTDEPSADDFSDIWQNL